MTTYAVVSPEWLETVPVMDYGDGPLEAVCDVVYVDAPNKREAIRIGVPQMKDWPRDARSDGRNPYSGVKAYVVPDEDKEPTPSTATDGKR